MTKKHFCEEDLHEIRERIKIPEFFIMFKKILSKKKQNF